MADDIVFSSTGTGGVPDGTRINLRDPGGSLGLVQKVDAAPFAATIKTPGQYALSVTTGAAVELTWASGATHALISVDTGGGDISWRPDNTNPTSSAGHRVLAGDSFVIENYGANFAMIGVGSNATVQVTYLAYE